MALAGCGSSTNTPAAGSAAIAAKPDVIVTIDGVHHACVVALSSEPQGSSVACDDIVPFMRDELRLAGGSTYDLRTIPEVDAAQKAKVESNLKGAGYRFIGGPH
ncbi:MAG: hypothetical protein WA803_01990 [Steroidobacteraceae bacterium]